MTSLEHITDDTISGYGYGGTESGCAHDYLLPAIDDLLSELSVRNKRVFDLGCGNGSLANWLSKKGWSVTGVDPSESGIKLAKEAFPQCNLELGSCYDQLSDRYGTYPLLVSLEVVEHVYSPREYAKCVFDLLQPGGYAIISTPYHGYWKNLALAISGKLDKHFTALWDHGHIKFWSIPTLSTLFTEAQLEITKIRRIGRLPQIAKTMLFVLKKP